MRKDVIVELESLSYKMCTYKIVRRVMAVDEETITDTGKGYRCSLIEVEDRRT